MTVAAGLVLGFSTLFAEDPGFPTAGLNDAIETPLLILATVVVFLAPLIVGRWWVVGALAGPGLALLSLEAAGVAVSLDDGTGPAFSYRTAFMLAVVGGTLLLLAGLRSMVDDIRRERSEASS